ncbi:MAG: nuclear transport factor 2 family protein [Gammaproteobacteria bacterium]
MNEPSVRDMVDAFLDAIGARDFEQAQRCLSADEFFYLSPIETFDNAADFIADVSRVGTILKRIDRRKLFVDGDQACAIFNLITTMDALSNTRIAQWMKVKNGKIVSIEVFFDAHAYASMFETLN